MEYLHPQLVKEGLFLIKKNEFKKPNGYKNISSTEMRHPVEKKNDNSYCTIC